jgi:hypothetical protein
MAVLEISTSAVRRIRGIILATFPLFVRVG